MRASNLLRGSTALAAAFLLGACGSPPSPRRVMVDVDSDHDDMAAVAYLCQEHKRGRIELAAVTVTNIGAGYPGNALQHVRCLLAACGLPDVPVADSTTPPTPQAFPTRLRDNVATVLSDVFSGCTQGTGPSSRSAASLIADTLRAQNAPMDVVTLGPLNNLAEALQAEPSLGQRIRNVYVMGGAVSVRGNLCCGAQNGFDNSQEFNLWADAISARTVLGLLRPEAVKLVPLDATNSVPITVPFASKLQAELATPEAGVVNAIIHHERLQQGISAGILFWWDPLAAISVTHPEITTFETKTLDLVTEGASTGRTQVSEQGVQVQVATGADQAMFEQLFLDTLNGR